MVAIFVAFMFVSVVLTDLGVAKWKGWQAARAVRPAVRAFAPEALWQVPEGIHLSSAHTWFRTDPAGGLEIGVDPLITYAVGAVSALVLPKPGDQVIAGQPLLRVERAGHTITVPSTLTGKVLAVNESLPSQPTLLNSDPYGAGWVCRLTPTSAGAMTPEMRFGEKAILWLESEFKRLGEFLTVQVSLGSPLGATSQDGGFPSAGCLGELGEAAWAAFEDEFLKKR